MPRACPERIRKGVRVIAEGLIVRFASISPRKVETDDDDKTAWVAEPSRGRESTASLTRHRLLVARSTTTTAGLRRWHLSG